MLLAAFDLAQLYSAAAVVVYGANRDDNVAEWAAALGALHMTIEPALQAIGVEVVTAHRYSYNILSDLERLEANDAIVHGDHLVAARLVTLDHLMLLAVHRTVQPRNKITGVYPPLLFYPLSQVENAYAEAFGSFSVHVISLPLRRVRPLRIKCVVGAAIDHHAAKFYEADAAHDTEDEDDEHRLVGYHLEVQNVLPDDNGERPPLRELQVAHKDVHEHA